MTDDQITAIAREYAEEFYKIRGGVDPAKYIKALKEQPEP